MLRKTIAVIVGYLIFAVSAVLLFQLSGHDPHGEPSSGFAIIVILYGVIFAFAGGFVTKLITNAEGLRSNYILSVIMAGFAAFSLFATTGNHYTQIAAIFLFAPVSTIGGYARTRFSR